MTSAKIKSRKVTETKNHIKGIFYLTDKTRTRFEIDKKTGYWEQWQKHTKKHIFPQHKNKTQ
jgi:hypothetical protein